MLVVIVVLMALNLVKGLAPQWWEGVTRSRARRYETQQQRYEADRQDEVAVFSNMLVLQKQTTLLNEKLIDYFINDMKGDLADLKNLLREQAKGLDDFGRRLDYVVSCLPEILNEED